MGGGDVGAGAVGVRVLHGVVGLGDWGKGGMLAVAELIEDLETPDWRALKMIIAVFFNTVDTPANSAECAVVST